MTEVVAGQAFVGIMRREIEGLVAIRKELQAINKNLEFSAYLFIITNSNTNNLIKKDIEDIEMACKST